MDIKILSGDRFCDRNLLSVLKSLHLSSRTIKYLKYREDGLTVNGQKVTVRYVLRHGDTLSLAINDAVSANCTPTDTELDVVFENEDIIVVNKPPFMPTHTSHGHYDDTLANALVGYFGKKSIPFVFRPINRLDRNTSGLVLVAKNKPAASFLSSAMQNREIKKSYIAVLEGKLPESQEKIKIGEEEFFVIDRHLHRTAESVIVREVCSPDAPDAESAVTHYRILERSDRFTLVEAFPQTGRTHQLRVHFVHLGCPIVGDELYGSPSQDISRHALHARRLTLTLPNTPISGKIDRELITLTATVPDDISALIEKFFHQKGTDL